MLRKNYLHSIPFLLISPIILGGVQYILILLLFDNLSELKQNFRTEELLLVILLTLLCIWSMFGMNRWTYSARRSPVEKQYLKHIGLGLALSLAITNVVLVIYFSLLLGYNNFRSELIIFNIAYAQLALFYQGLFVSIELLTTSNQQSIHNEQAALNSLYDEFKSYQHEMRSELFFGGMESLLPLIYINKRKADELVNSFASVYRYIIDARKMELTTLGEELKHTQNVLVILNHQYHNQVSFTFDAIKQATDWLMVPCTLQTIIEKAVHENIVQPLCPLEVNCCIINHMMEVTHKTFQRLAPTEPFMGLTKLSKTYKHYAGVAVELIEQDDNTIIRIPLFDANEITYIDE